MGLIRTTKSLEPRTREAAEKALAAMTGVGIKVWVNETLRTPMTQQAYFAQGREPLDAVNAKRLAAGLWLITAEENTTTVTNTLKSKHIEGKAIDICPLKKDGPWWNAPESEWTKIAGVMELFGFEWGGRWKGFKDNPHYQIKE